MFKVAIITASDKGSRGQRLDESGALLKKMLIQAGYEVVSYCVLPDERQQISNELRRLCDQRIADLILTTGGTGFSPRDYTPEATLDVVERLTPGIPEAMRAFSLGITKRAMLSRAVAGIRGSSLIINLPGSPRAVQENLECVLDELEHGLKILTGKATECGQSPRI